ncbi:RNA-directed DNA polymerase [Pantoea sp. Taur]|uniref:RNA-directed DNA polymerase n=1 Tax=Pantoea sp. Taur TaxID=2576757 RepID=UPI00358F2424
MWKHSIIILFLKPGKPVNNVSSYRPISLLPILSKIFEKILLKRILLILESHNIPPHQFGFRSRHSTVQQGLRVVDHISHALESKQYCTGAFLDVAQAFDRVWHEGLLCKLKILLPQSLYLVLRSYLSNRSFRVRCGTEFSSCYPIEAGVPQGSVLGPVLYILYTSDIPTNPYTFLATFADDTAILSSHPDPQTASLNLQCHLSQIEDWCNEWRIKINELKCKQVTFTLRRRSCPPILFNDIPLPISDTVRYLGFLLDKRLTWNPHTRLKRQELNRRYSQLYRLLNRNSHLSLDNKLLIYKTILKPIWTYGLELWGTAKHTNIKRIQSFQSKVLRTIVNAPYYVSNKTLHNDLNIPFVLDLIPSKFSKFHLNLSNHPNPLAQSLSTITHPYNPPRRLKRQWPRDLL